MELLLYIPYGVVARMGSMNIATSLSILKYVSVSYRGIDCNNAAMQPLLESITITRERGENKVLS